jgi:hypothetical protein
MALLPTSNNMQGPALSMKRRHRPLGTTWRAQARRWPVRSWQRHEVLPIVSDSVRGDGAIERGGTLAAPDNLG